MNIQQRVRASKEAENRDEVELYNATSSGESDGSEDESGETSNSGRGSLGSQDSDDESDSAASAAEAHQDALAAISFGALAAAQASLSGEHPHPATPSRKRRRSPSPFHEAAERAAGKAGKAGGGRSSKHAPQELSAKRAVGRRRAVVAAAPPPSARARDPRFSALSGEVDARRVARDYAFLAEYRATERAALKTQLKATKDERERARLERQLRAMEDQERTRQRAAAREEVLRQHRRAEREKVKAGKTPFFLKRGEVKRQAQARRLEGLGKRQAAKVVQRKEKREAGREKKRLLPRARRSVAQTGSED